MLGPVAAAAPAHSRPRPCSPAAPLPAQLDYLSYLGQLAAFSGIPRAQRLSGPYRQYLAALVAYLEGFYERTQPLAQLAKHWDKARRGMQGRRGGRAASAGQGGRQLAGGSGRCAPRRRPCSSSHARLLTPHTLRLPCPAPAAAGM